MRREVVSSGAWGFGVVEGAAPAVVLVLDDLRMLASRAAPKTAAKAAAGMKNLRIFNIFKKITFSSCPGWGGYSGL